MRDDYSDRFIVVGVTPQQSAVVVQQAARFARHFEAALVCANVDPGSYVVAEHRDGSVESRPIDPDLPEWTSSPSTGNWLTGFAPSPARNRSR